MHGYVYRRYRYTDALKQFIQHSNWLQASCRLGVGGAWMSVMVMSGSRRVKELSMLMHVI